MKVLFYHFISSCISAVKFSLGILKTAVKYGIEFMQVTNGL